MTFTRCMLFAFVAAGCTKSSAPTTNTTSPTTPTAAPAAEPPPVRTGSVAANCSDTPCFEVDAAAELACKRGPMNPASWQSTFGIQGKTTRGGCVVYKDGGGADINLQVLPPEGSKDNSELFIRLRNYNGPGRYKLVDEQDRGGAGRGFYMRANGGVPDAYTTVGATECTPGCEAFVTERSEPIAAPNQVFRIDIDVVCAGGSLDNGKPCNDHDSCTLTARSMHVEATCKSNT